MLDFGIRLLHGGMGGQQAVVEALHHRHGQDDEAVLVGLEGTPEHIGRVPDHGGFFGNVGADNVDFSLDMVIVLVSL